MRERVQSECGKKINKETLGRRNQFGDWGGQKRENDGKLGV